MFKNSKSKRNHKLYFERYFKWEFDNIEDIKQVEELIRNTKNPHFEQVDTEIYTSNEDVHKLRFSIRNENVQLYGEAHLIERHLIVSGRAGLRNFFLSRKNIVPTLFLALLFVCITPILDFLIFASQRLTGDVMTDGLVPPILVPLIALVIAGFFVAPIIARNDLVRQLEKVFTEVTQGEDVI